MLSWIGWIAVRRVVFVENVVHDGAGYVFSLMILPCGSHITANTRTWPRYGFSAVGPSSPMVRRNLERMSTSSSQSMVISSPSAKRDGLILSEVGGGELDLLRREGIA